MTRLEQMGRSCLQSQVRWPFSYRRERAYPLLGLGFLVLPNAVGCTKLGPFILFSFHAFPKQVVCGPFTFYLILKICTPCPDSISFFSARTGRRLQVFSEAPVHRIRLRYRGS